jgi:tRNA threonylcarbamoyladenosine biosynthesis protein TsaB
MVPLSEAAFQQQQFADVAYFSPYYLKLFYTPAKG